MRSGRVSVLPDLFDFLSDGFGQRESLHLDSLDGHSPAVTGEEKRHNVCITRMESVCSCVSVDLLCVYDS